MSNLLIEIGTEELPTDALDVIYSQGADKLWMILNHQDNRIECDRAHIKIEATPRRISIYVSNIPLKQKDRKQEFFGPTLERAFQGNEPTPALLGFLKSKNASLEELKKPETHEGKVCLVKEEKGMLAIKVLPILIQNFLTSLTFPKMMRWEKTNFRFPRPVRWIVALLDKQVIPIQFAGIKAGTTSYGHRFLAPKPFKILSADWELYQKILKKNHVILSLDQRKESIEKELRIKKQKGWDRELLHFNAHLIESPFLIRGSFDKAYLKLPSEVLATVMKKNQKIFTCYDGTSHMKAGFIAVLNGKRKDKNLKRICTDFENVLESRLKDARYFYEMDMKDPLEAKVGKLQQIVYLGKLGTMKDKTDRLEKLAGIFCKLSANETSQKNLSRAAHLCKADLLTHLVYEMPELQGTIGGKYAFRSGEMPEVADAIAEQYLPKNLSEDSQSLKKQISLLGAMLGIIDRADLLVGAFGSGLEPTGSQDPFALRRAAGVVVKLVRAYRFHFSLKSLIEENIKLYGKSLKLSPEEIQKKLRQFFQERLNFDLGLQSAGTRSWEIAQAVFKSSMDDLADVFERYEVLIQMFEKENKNFVQAAKIIERTSNILKGTDKDSGPVQVSLFKEPMEWDLYKAYEEHSGQIKKFLEKKEYRQATRLFADTFANPLNEFFNQVLVNIEDAGIRRNRQALMKLINRLYTDNLADLSVLSRIDEQ